jgi:hypothetical protein
MKLHTIDTVSQSCRTIKGGGGAYCVSHSCSDGSTATVYDSHGDYVVTHWSTQIGEAAVRRSAIKRARERSFVRNDNDY